MAGNAKTHVISDSDDSDDQRVLIRRTGSEDLFDDDEKHSKEVVPKQAGKICDTDRAPTMTKLKHKTKEQAHKRKLEPYDDDTDVEEDIDIERKMPKTSKPVCKYGSKCYRKNPSHVAEFYHPSKRKSDDADCSSSSEKKIKVDKKVRGPKSEADAVNELRPFSFFLTKVNGIAQKHNATGALSLKDILSESMGKLKSSCHFNFMFDLDWIVQQYPESARKQPMLLVHGEQGRDELNMKSEAANYTHITLCRAPLEIPYGTHHTKMMLLLYTTGLRVVIHTANLVPNDWHQKTQGIWVSPVFPPLTDGDGKGDSPTGFKADLLQYLAAYKAAKLSPWERYIQAHNMKDANVHIIGSVPGRHTLGQKSCWGHLKLKKLLQERGPDSTRVKNWPIVGQFSSIGSLGPDKSAWLTTEWQQSLATCKGGHMMSVIGGSQPKLNLIFPSMDNIRLSLEGYNGGGCVPYSIKTASKQPWLTPFFSQWKSDGRGRSTAVPHIKTYTRYSPDGSQAAWFLVTSANLSKAAWGMLEKKGSQLMIRSYELGVLFLPQYFGFKMSFPLSNTVEDATNIEKPTFPLPYDLPPTTYVRGDRPWFIDVPCVDKPDNFGTMWCPPL